MIAAPRTFHLMGNLLHFHSFSRETGGKVCVVEALTAPGAGAPPNHHKGEEESFLVLDGRFAFMIEGVETVRQTGDFVRIPDGALHAFRNVGETPGRLLIVNAPGRMHDDFFSRAGDPVPEGTTTFPPADGPPDVARLLAVAREAGMTIVPPA